jgi:hypothetical protein
MPFHPPVGGPEHEFPDPDEMRRLEGIIAEAQAASERAQVLAPTLVGLTLTEAREIVSRHPGVSLEVRDPRAARTAGPAVFGRIYAQVQNGRVVSASLW